MGADWCLGVLHQLLCACTACRAQLEMRLRLPAVQIVFSQNQHLTKYDYDELGPSAAHKKLS